MRTFQPSFASGEISPLLHARVDLARYATGLAELKNMIVLPQGGVTRRPGTVIRAGDIPGGKETRLVPFIYNTMDSALIELGNGHFRVWVDGWCVYSGTVPWAAEDLAGLRYVQSGNVMFFTHRGYVPYMLTRNAADDWTLEKFETEGGPWIDGNDVQAGSMVKAELHQSSEWLPGMSTRLIATSGAPFQSWMTDSLVRIEYAIDGGSEDFEISTGPHESNVYEVKSSFNVNTTSSGIWAGKLRIERKTGEDGQWMTVREFNRTDSEKEGQIDFTISDTEEDSFYRVVATCTKNKVKVNVSSENFVKSLTFRITSVTSSTVAQAEWVRRDGESRSLPADSKATPLGWSLSAWGTERGYPAACAFYQDRLVFAGTDFQPGTLWMSRVGSYRDFSVSDPLKDDDAINITLTSRTADGIHSLAAGTDLLAFTASGEWKIAGAGDAGAISPTAVVAHQQSNIGSKALQPIDVGGRVVFVQTHGRKVYALGYDLNTDGYVGSEISIMSAHLFRGREIVDFCWQQTPDGLLWFALSDGTAATCTFNPEHDTVGWARQETAGEFVSFCATPGDGQSELWATVTRDEVTQLERFARREDEALFTDAGAAFESSMRTLRLSLDGESGSGFDARKLIARVVISAIRTTEAWTAPGNGKNAWERRRRARWDYADELERADVQLDGGFAPEASVQIRITDGPMTVLAVSPVVAAGG